MVRNLILAIALTAFAACATTDAALHAAPGPAAAAPGPAASPGQSRPMQAKGDRVAIAVTKFSNVAARPEYEWLGLAISETLTSKLSNVARLKLIERNRMEEAVRELELAQTGLVDSKFAEFGKMAGAQYLLVGSFQALGDKDTMMIKISARVIDVSTGVVMQGQGIDSSGGYKEIFGLQDKVAERLINNLKIEVTPEEQKRVALSETNSVVSYEMYWLAMSEKDPARKIQLFRKALEYDPGYARAHLNLAGALFMMSMNQPQHPEIEQHALEAVRLDPTLADAYNVLGTYFDRLAFALSKAGDPAAKQTVARAIESYRKFVEMRGDADSFYFRGQVDRAKRKIEELSKM